jgi:hypothetical protein
MVVVIAWARGGKEGGVIDLPARRGAVMVPWHWRCVRARASACTVLLLLYVLRTTVPLASGSRRGRVVLTSSPPRLLLRRGRCFQTFVSPALDSTSCGPVVRPLRLLSNLSLPLAPIEGPRCKAARIVKPGTADFAHARSRVLARSVAMCVQEH